MVRTGNTAQHAQPRTRKKTASNIDAEFLSVERGSRRRVLGVVDAAPVQVAQLLARRELGQEDALHGEVRHRPVPRRGGQRGRGPGLSLGRVLVRVGGQRQGRQLRRVRRHRGVGGDRGHGVAGRGLLAVVLRHGHRVGHLVDVDVDGLAPAAAAHHRAGHQLLVRGLGVVVGHGVVKRDLQLVARGGAYQG